MKEPGNGSPVRGMGTMNATDAEEMAAFDALPAEVRQALREGMLDYSAIAVAEKLRRVGVQGVLRSLARTNRHVRKTWHEPVEGGEGNDALRDVAP